MTSEVIGRESELEQVESYLDAPGLDGPRALVLEGEAGIGKSTIWLEGLAHARARGFRVLFSRPAEAEQSLAVAGLADLFDGSLDVLPALPRPRRRALQVALLLEESNEPLDPRALGVAVRSAFELLVESQPLLLAIDDVQWLDDSSTNALAFALRRTSAPVHLLLARRVGEALGSSNLESALRAASVSRMGIGPMSPGALQAIVSERLERVLPRPALLRIHEMSGGNPFYAVELARALPEELDPRQPLRVPEGLDELVRARIDSLPEASRQALVILAAMGEGDAATLREAGVESALAEAISRGIVARADDRLRFTHPLLASSVHQSADDATWRSAHVLLAAIVSDPLKRASHLALAAEGPDAEIATSLDEAAVVASVRGAPEVAAELSELARHLTPDEDRNGRHRRAIVGATSYVRAGDAGRAQTLADQALRDAVDDRSRAEALVLLSAVQFEDRERAVALRREALVLAHSHPAMQAAVHQWLAVNASDEKYPRRNEDHARASVELAEGLGDDCLRAGALAVLAHLRFAAGEEDAVALAEQAHALATSRTVRARLAQASTEPVYLLAWTYDRLDLLASFVLTDILVCLRRFDAARQVLDSLARELGGDEMLEGKTLWVRSMLELDAGCWSLAHDLIKREREIAALYETGPNWPGPLQVLAELAIHRGDLDHARQLLTRGLELAVAHRGQLPSLEATLGLADRAGGDPGASVAHFVAAEAAAEAEGLREPNQLWWRGDFAEALMELGRVDDAVDLLDAWEPNARRLGRAWAVAQVTRCRGLVAAARGEVDAAIAILERAFDEADAESDPFGRARALLALGVTRRRARQKRGARDALESALALFEQLGEAPWTERARAELGRVSGRPRTDGLTPAERRVAALVARGRTNREVATTLFLAERTVETHLTRIYAKLGVRSRTELARMYVPTS